MAEVERRYREQCACKHDCPTYGDVIEWSCGCVQVEIHWDTSKGRDCTDFSGKRSHCSRPDRPPHVRERQWEEEPMASPLRQETPADGSEALIKLALYGIASLVVVGLVFTALWLVVFVAIPLVVINLGLIFLVSALRRTEGKVPFYAGSLLGAILLVVDLSLGWSTRILVSNLAFFANFIPWFFVANLAAGLTSAYFLIRDAFDARTPQGARSDMLSRRNLLTMVGLALLGGVTVWLQYFSGVPGPDGTLPYSDAADSLQLRSGAPQPPPKALFTDTAGVVPGDIAARIEQRLREFETASSNQVLVVVADRVPEGYTSLEEYTNRTVEAWRVGGQSRENGAVLFVFVGDRKVRIEVGSGLEGALPDAVAAGIISDEITPHFRLNRYGDGLLAGVEAIIAATHHRRTLRPSAE